MKVLSNRWMLGQIAGMAIIAAALFLVFPGADYKVAGQQYPESLTLTCTVASSRLAVGSSTPITCTLRSPDGPVVGADIAFVIQAGPADATIGSRSTVKKTDANGTATATLTIGELSGEVVVNASHGTLGQRLRVTGFKPEPQVAPAQTSTIRPPSTGNAGLID